MNEKELVGITLGNTTLERLIGRLLVLKAFKPLSAAISAQAAA